MSVDPTAVASLLRINGLSLSSPQNEIHDLLARAGYSEEEIQQALSFGPGTPAVNAGTSPTAQASKPPVSQHSTAQSADGVPLPPYVQVDTKPVTASPQTAPITNPTKKKGPLFLFVAVGIVVLVLIAFTLIWFGMK